jgi:hypothetical protein
MKYQKLIMKLCPVPTCPVNPQFFMDAIKRISKTHNDNIKFGQPNLKSKTAAMNCLEDMNVSLTSFVKNKNITKTEIEYLEYIANYYYEKLKQKIITNDLVTKHDVACLYYKLVYDSFKILIVDDNHLIAFNDYYYKSLGVKMFYITSFENCHIAMYRDPSEIRGDMKYSSLIKIKNHTSCQCGCNI